MRAVVVEPEFGLNHLKLVDQPSPSPGPGDVLIELKAASLNYRDLLVVTGHYNPRQPLPLVPCSDGAGVVAALGEGVTDLEVGDRVVGAFAPWWTAGEPAATTLRKTLGSPLDGTLREQIVLPRSGVVRTPSGITDVQAATLPCAGVTAYRALFDLGGLKPGQTVLCLGTGGVSIFALQLAKAAGARVVVTSSSDAKLERAVALGADHTLNYRTTPDWGKAVAKLTGGVDLVVEVGGAGTLGQSIRATRPGGTLALIGVLAEGTPPDLTAVLMNQLRVQGVYVGPVSTLQSLVDTLAATGACTPVVDQTFTLETAAEAFAAMQAAGHFGKIALTLA